MTSPWGQDRPWTDLWLFDLEAEGEQLLDLGLTTQLLGDQEKERAARLSSPAQTREFLASRAALRRVLVEYGGDGHAAFTLSSNGKPSLAGGPHFSLSRTKHAAMIAVSSAEVGVDIERRRAVALAEPQIAEIGAILRGVGGFPDTGHGPLHSWTAIEAWVKYHGLSMARFFADEAAVPNLARELASGDIAITPLALPTHLCGTVCARAGSSLRYLERPSWDLVRAPISVR